VSAHRGEIWDAELGQPFENELGGDHPVVVVSVDPFNNLPLELAWVIPGSTTNKVPQPFHVDVQPSAGNGLSARTWFKAEHLRSVDQARLATKRGMIDKASLTALLDVVEQIAQKQA